MGRGTAVTKSYVRGILLSTENATELPKCSKRLHFCEFEGEQSDSQQHSQKTTEIYGDLPLLYGFRGWISRPYRPLYPFVWEFA